MQQSAGIVFAYLTQNEARSGECAPDQLGPVPWQHHSWEFGQLLRPSGIQR